MPHAFVVTVHDFVWSINLNIEREYGEPFLMKKIKIQKKTTIKATIAKQNRETDEEKREGDRET